MNRRDLPRLVRGRFNIAVPGGACEQCIESHSSNRRSSVPHLDLNSHSVANLPILKRELPIVPFFVSCISPLLMDTRRMVMPQFNDILVTGPGNVTPMEPVDEPGHL